MLPIPPYFPTVFLRNKKLCSQHSSSGSLSSQLRLSNSWAMPSCSPCAHTHRPDLDLRDHPWWVMVPSSPVHLRYQICDQAQCLCLTYMSTVRTVSMFHNERTRPCPRPVASSCTLRAFSPLATGLHACIGWLRVCSTASRNFPLRCSCMAVATLG